MLTMMLVENQNAYLQIMTVLAPKLLQKENKPILKTYENQPRIKTEATK